MRCISTLSPLSRWSPRRRRGRPSLGRPPGSCPVQESARTCRPASRAVHRRPSGRPRRRPCPQSGSMERLPGRPFPLLFPDVASVGATWGASGDGGKTGGGLMGAVENVVTEVRELIRRSGVDPLKDAPSIQQLVRDAIADYDERSLHGGLPALADLHGGDQERPRRRRGVRPAPAVLRRPHGRGDLDQRAHQGVRRPRRRRRADHDDPDGRRGARPRRADAEDLGPPGRPVLARSSTRPCRDGSRLHVVIPDITRTHWSVNIRKFVVKADHLDDLVRLGTLPRQAATVPRRGRRGGPQRPRRRRHAGRQDDAAQLPRRGDPARASASSPARRSSS